MQENEGGGIYSRTPQGVRGLKSEARHPAQRIVASHPARGAWIEIDLPVLAVCGKRSHPARGAWIEISEASAEIGLRIVAPRKGCVD